MIDKAHSAPSAPPTKAALARRHSWATPYLLATAVVASGLASATLAQIGPRTPATTCTPACFFSQEAARSHECRNNCYLEQSPVDDSPRAICEIMGKASHENSIPHLYRDTAGLVTIGIGNMIPDAETASRMQAEARQSGDSQSGFLIRGKDGELRQATDQEVRDEFSSLAQQPPGCTNDTPDQCKPHSHWKGTTELTMSDDYINSLCQQRLNSEFLGGLRGTFPEFDAYPTRVKAALYDLVYNMGATSLNPPKWPKFRAAINSRNWAAAAEQSNRKSPVSDERNNYVRDLLEDAGAEEEAGKQRLEQCPPFSRF